LWWIWPQRNHTWITPLCCTIWKLRKDMKWFNKLNESPCNQIVVVTIRIDTCWSEGRNFPTQQNFWTVQCWETCVLINCQ
jgi:hypothetical protein